MKTGRHVITGTAKFSGESLHHQILLYTSVWPIVRALHETLHKFLFGVLYLLAHMYKSNSGNYETTAAARNIYNNTHGAVDMSDCANNNAGSNSTLKRRD